MLDWRITSHHPSDTLGTCIRYCSADLYNTYTMYHPPDVRWHVLNDTMSQYYLCHHRIFGLNALNAYTEIAPSIPALQRHPSGRLPKGWQRRRDAQRYRTDCRHMLPSYSKQRTTVRLSRGS